MLVKSVKVSGFRNYTLSEIEFSDNINVIIGGNAQGKTNLIEAVYYLTGGKSFRAKNDRELINFNSDTASIDSTVMSEGRLQHICADLSRYQRKQITLNERKIRSISELSGKLTAVLFYPDDLTIIRSSSVYRRRLMDNCLCQLRPLYAQALAEYKRLYDRKTRILRDRNEAMIPVLEDFNRRMCEVGAVLIYYRARFVKALAERAEKIHGEFSGGKEILKISYKTVSTVNNPMQKADKILSCLLEHQKSHLKAELDSGRCLSGPHKDDLNIFINETDARSFASQGQMRTAAISIKMAEREIHFEDKGEYPVLLLDDVLSELDNERQNFILNKINNGQVLITCCEDQSISAKTGGKVLMIKNGRIVDV